MELNHSADDADSGNDDLGKDIIAPDADDQDDRIDEHQFDEITGWVTRYIDNEIALLEDQ